MSRATLLSLSVLLVALQPQPLFAQAVGAGASRAIVASLPSYQDDYGDWRQQVRVASPTRRARWDSAPAGAVRVYHRRFDARWNWRSSPRHRVVYTYSRGDLWFLDPTTGWAYSVDRYGIVYTADPYRGRVYSLGPLTRWTADLLYFFDLYRFDRGYWYCSDYDYFVDLWEGSSRYGYYTYDTAYSTVWEWEPYFRSPTFITYSNRFTTVCVLQVRNHYDYIERNPVYRRELIDSIGLPAVNAVPPRMLSPRAVATTAYWEARDLAGAGLRPPPRGRDVGRASVAAGTLVDAQRDQARVVDPGSPTPGFNAPFPDGSYGFGVRPGRGEAPAGNEGISAGRGRVDGAPSGRGRSDAAAESVAAPAPFERDGRGRGGQGRGEIEREAQSRAETPPQFEEPAFAPQVEQPRYEQPQDMPRGGRGGRDRDEGRAADRAEAQQRFENREQRVEPRFESREEPRYEAPREERREEPRFETPREERREEPRFEAPREERREEPRFEAPREERREEPREERREEPREERREEPREYTLSLHDALPIYIRLLKN